MAADGSSTETEVKIRIDSPDLILHRLTELGFTVLRPRIFEANTVYDDANGSIRAGGRLLRLRQAGERSILTYKGPATVGAHKSREELETTLGDADTVGRIFERLGYRKTFRYEKYRTEFSRPDEPGVVTVDETPIGWFLELEGAPEWIDQTAALLRFSAIDYITESYGALYLQHCKDRGRQPEHMVFADKP